MLGFNMKEYIQLRQMIDDFAMRKIRACWASRRLAFEQ